MMSCRPRFEADAVALHRSQAEATTGQVAAGPGQPRDPAALNPGRQCEPAPGTPGEWPADPPTPSEAENSTLRPFQQQLTGENRIAAEA